MARGVSRNSNVESSDSQNLEVKREESLDVEDMDTKSMSRIDSIIKSEHTSRSQSPLPKTKKSQLSRASSYSMPLGKSEVDDADPDLDIKPASDHEVPDAPDVKPTRTAKSSRSSKKAPPRKAELFDNLPDATDEANGAYQVIESCIYQNKYLGYTEHAMECDCNEEWDSGTKTNFACGEDSDCINRATKMECVGDCACGPACQNQRFLRRLYADVSVIKTEKKGYGLRTNTALKNGDFIFEYIGEVIPEGTFRKRMRQYDDEGIKHFYFMSLTKGEFVDATKKGNLGRFCNHSCNPNCYVDKWVVGDKLRMGIFAEQNIKAGEELVFNYNVDRYGANPQPCYCDENNCTGFIGGKTQTERGTKLSAATIEALGIEDEDWDSWDTMTAKKPKKKKAVDDDDEDYVERAEIRGLDVDGVTKVMAALMQCKEKWIAVKILQRIQRCIDEDVYHRIVKLHGYRILNSQLSAWQDDDNVILQILEILDKLPRLTRNKIVDAKIDQTLGPLRDSQDERVATKSTALLEEWSKLELAYRIPRKVRTANDVASSTPVRYDRRDSAQHRKRSRSRSRSKSPPRGPSGTSIPTGPRATGPRPLPFSRPPPVHRGPPPLPPGWFQATDKDSRIYFYSATGETTWKRPSQAAAKPPPPPKAPSQQDMLKSIIDGIVTSADKTKETHTSTPTTPDVEPKDSKKEKWRSMDEEKQRKLYENTLYPHISYVMGKYKHKIPKEDLKRFGKDLAKKLVNSDYKAGRVKDPTEIDEKQQKKVKAYCKEYFEKAAAKHKRMEEERAARKAKKEGSESVRTDPAKQVTPVKKEHGLDDEDMETSDVEDKQLLSPSDSATNGSLKRKRLSELDTPIKEEDEDLLRSPAKRLNTALESSLPTPPPPPPPPPAPSSEFDHDHNHEFEMEKAAVTDIHGDTNFKSKSMADVLAQAQQEGGDEEAEEADYEMTDTKTEFEQQIGSNGVKLENPLVQGQGVLTGEGH